MKINVFQQELKVFTNFFAYCLRFYILFLVISESYAETCEDTARGLNKDYMQGADGPGVWESVAFPNEPNNSTDWPSLFKHDNASSFSNLFAVEKTVFNNNISWPIYLLSANAPIAGMIANTTMLLTMIRCAFPVDAQTDQRHGSKCGQRVPSGNNSGNPTCPEPYSAKQFIQEQTNSSSWAQTCCSLPGTPQSLRVLRDIQSTVINGTIKNPTCSSYGCYTFNEIIVDFNPMPALLRAFFYVTDIPQTPLSKNYATNMQRFWANTQEEELPIVSTNIAALRKGNEPPFSCSP